MDQLFENDFLERALGFGLGMELRAKLVNAARSSLGMMGCWAVSP
jgi:hypothetical protein